MFVCVPVSVSKEATSCAMLQAKKHEANAEWKKRNWLRTWKGSESYPHLKEAAIFHGLYTWTQEVTCKPHTSCQGGLCSWINSGLKSVSVLVVSKSPM